MTTDRTETTRDPMALQAGDVIVRHPDRPDEAGEWTVTGRPMSGDDEHVSITYEQGDAEGVFVGPYTAISVRAAEMTYRERVMAGLLELVAALADHPDLPVPEYPTLAVFPRGTDAEEREQVDQAAAVLGVVAKETSAAHYIAERPFGPVRYQVIAIAEEHMRRHRAAQSYAGAVEPEEAKA